jgi:hypothetical protein
MLSEAARKLATTPMETLKTKGLNYRLMWLRSIEAHRARHAELENKRKIPREIFQSEGYVWWLRNNKPSLEEYKAMVPGNR